jgi:hypothetical protein
MSRKYSVLLCTLGNLLVIEIEKENLEELVHAGDIPKA